jgi:hypothetical protein
MSSSRVSRWPETSISVMAKPAAANSPCTMRVSVAPTVASALRA